MTSEHSDTGRIGPPADLAAAPPPREANPKSRRLLGSPWLWAGAVAAIAAVGLGGVFSGQEEHQQQYADETACKTDNPAAECQPARTAGGMPLWLGPVLYSAFAPRLSPNALGVGAPARGGVVAAAPTTSQRGGIGTTGRGFASDGAAGG